MISKQFSLQAIMLAMTISLVSTPSHAWKWQETTATVKQHSTAILAASAITGLSGLAGYLWYQSNAKAQKQRKDSRKAFYENCFNLRWELKREEFRKANEQLEQDNAEQKALANTILEAHRRDSERLKKSQFQTEASYKHWNPTTLTYNNEAANENYEKLAKRADLKKKFAEHQTKQQQLTIQLLQKNGSIETPLLPDRVRGLIMEYFITSPTNASPKVNTAAKASSTSRPVTTYAAVVAQHASNGKEAPNTQKTPPTPRGKNYKTNQRNANSPTNGIIASALSAVSRLLSPTSAANAANNAASGN